MKIALAFWWLTRSLKYTIESIEKNIFDVFRENNIDFKISFQSRFGPKKWLEPYTNVIIEQCANANESIVIIAPGFSVDCLETLEELSITETNAFIALGGKRVTTIRCLNDTREHVDKLENILKGEVIID